MYMVSALTSALVVWLVLWALGAKALDAFLLVLLIAVVAVGIKMALPFLPGARTVGGGSSMRNPPGS
jgi:hypothetical protein